MCVIFSVNQKIVFLLWHYPWKSDISKFLSTHILLFIYESFVFQTSDNWRKKLILSAQLNFTFFLTLIILNVLKRLKGCCCSIGVTFKLFFCVFLLNFSVLWYFFVYQIYGIKISPNQEIFLKVYLSKILLYFTEFSVLFWFHSILCFGHLV